MIKKICRQCGKEIWTYPCLSKRKNFCSKECSNKHRSGPRVVYQYECAMCGKMVSLTSKRHHYDRHGARYCSPECSRIGSRVPNVKLTCKHCGKIFELRNSIYTSATRKATGHSADCCSQKCSIQYLMSKDDNWLRGILTGILFGPGYTRSTGNRLNLSSLQKKYIEAKILESKLRRSLNV